MQLHDEDDVIDQPNTTPMVDVLLVVLVIFVVTVAPPTLGKKINLPHASASVSLAENKTKSISVNSDGTIFFDTIPVSKPELEQRLIQQKALTPDSPVVVKGDG